MVTTFHVLIIIQIIALAIGLYGTYCLFCAMLRPEAKFLLGACVCAVAYGLGYLMELVATNQDMAFDALCMQYCGLTYVAFMFSIYLVKITKVFYVPPWAWKLVFVYETTTLGLLLTSRYHHLYFRSLQFSQEGLFPHLVEEGTVLFYVFMFHLALLSLFCCLIAAKTAAISPNAKTRRKYLGVFVAAGATLIAVLISAVVRFEGYEPISMILLLVMGIIAIVRTSGKTMDPVESAHAEHYQRTHVGLFVLNPQFRYLDANDAARKIYPEVNELDPGAEFPFGQEIMRAADETRKIVIDERYYTSYYYPMLDRKGVLGYVLVMADSTASELRAKEYADLKKAAEEANEAKSFFLANMSHEMRTPLNAIIGLTELAQNEDSPQVVKDYLPQIASSGQMLLDIISDVLDFSKAESGKVDILPVEYDVKELLNTVINVVNFRIGEKELDFIVDIDPAIPGRLVGDDGRIRQILVNFLTNAIKYTDTGFIKLKVDREELGNDILLKAAVSDSGRGIKQEDIGKLFTVFSRFDLGNNRNIQGAGLGLAISGQLIKHMNGTYRVESEYGKGSTFFCILPQKVADRTPVSSREREEVHVVKNVPFVLFGQEGTDTGAAQPDETLPVQQEQNQKPEIPTGTNDEIPVLIVDDNPVNIKVLTAMLKKAGINPDAAVCGADAVDMVSRKRYRLILMDHMMPEMDGIESAKKIRELHNAWTDDVVIVACTANAVKGADEMFLENGMNDYLCKPIKMAELQTILDKWI